MKPLRLWPGVVAVLVPLLIKYAVAPFYPDAMIYGVLSGIAGGVIVLFWWAFFSRAPKVERWSAILLIIIALAATSRFVDKSIATGMMGFMFPFFSIPVVALAFVIWAVATQRLSMPVRRATMVATILLSCVAWTAVRTNGITGDAASDFALRWSKTREQKLLAETAVHASELPPAAPPMVPVTAKVPAEKAENPPAAIPAPTVAVKSNASWPGFRGPNRDSIIPGTHINTDWSATPPVQLWRRPVGPAWSSFAVRGDLFYTQEQRGEDELVSCYNATTGKPVWAHRDAARFWESNAGAGPRGTPTLHEGRVYTMGATGVVNALDADTGAVVWSRNAGSDTTTKVSGWGFSSSPLVVDDMVLVAASGHLIAYDIATGAPRWSGVAAGGSYSSPHLLTIDGVPQIVLMGGSGPTSFAPADGSVLWKYAWASDTRIMQPAMTPEGDLVISAGDAMAGVGLRRIAVAHGASGWSVEERWTSNGLKPNFNDFVIHGGYVYGFDGGILSCVDLKDGKRKWKGGRYGHGQFVLLRDQDVLLVLSEEGEIALVKAAPDQFTEVARISAIEGKTWNHPVLTGDRLLVRNSDEMAAFRLTLNSK